MAGKKTGGKQESEKKRGCRKYADADALAAKCAEYFAVCDEEKVLYGEAGLALHLGVKMATLRKWYDGEDCKDLQDTVQMAYLRIQNQVETDPVYMMKGMSSKAIFLLKQPRFGGYQDRIEAKQDISVNVKMGSGMDETDFQ